MKNAKLFATRKQTDILLLLYKDKIEVSSPLPKKQTSDPFEFNFTEKASHIGSVVGDIFRQRQTYILLL